MCGRYALALRPSQVRDMLMEDGLDVDDAPADEGDDAPWSSYNFAPGYHGVVYRADTPHWGAGPRDKEAREKQDKQDQAADEDSGSTKYKLQSMKWGLIPFWTKRNPDYGTLMKTINCRDDSLATPGGMWASMKVRKRCIVVAQGFYEWLKVGKEKMPHFVKRKDGRLMCLAGLWDCVHHEDEADLYTYTIITTDSNKQLKFLHDRMPVLLEAGSEGMKTWLDPGLREWGRELQSLLKPFEGELEVYPVSKEVGKVGNNSPSFVIPLDSKENKSNIANFFGKAKGKGDVKKEEAKTEEVKKEDGKEDIKITDDGVTHDKIEDTTNSDEKASVVVKEEEEESKGTKRRAPSAEDLEDMPVKKEKKVEGKISAVKNRVRSPVKSQTPKGTQKITNFFTK